METEGAGMRTKQLFHNLNKEVKLKCFFMYHQVNRINRMGIISLNF